MPGLNPLSDEILKVSIKGNQEIIEELRTRADILQIDLENMTAQRNRLEVRIKNILEIVIRHMASRSYRNM